MQTFVPFPDIRQSLQCLDYRRLGKQRVEARQLIAINDCVLRGADPKLIAYGNHPAAKMWRESMGVFNYLILYYNMALLEWETRGFKNIKLKPYPCGVYDIPSWWMGPIHASHQSQLFKKDPAYYKRWFTPAVIQPYFWPVV